eukprot:scaffold120205_cov35-Tisochrysis_lutea.AAC.1
MYTTLGLVLVGEGEGGTGLLSHGWVVAWVLGLRLSPMGVRGYGALRLARLRGILSHVRASCFRA